MSLVAAPFHPYLTVGYQYAKEVVMTGHVPLRIISHFVYGAGYTRTNDGEIWAHLNSPQATVRPTSDREFWIANIVRRPALPSVRYGT